MLQHEIIFRTLLGGWVALLWGPPGVRDPGMSCVLMTEQEVPKKFICMEKEGGTDWQEDTNPGTTQMAPSTM